MKYKVWMKIPKINRNDDTDQRGPTLETIQHCVEEYCSGFRGIIVLHDCMYNYSYDTRSLRYYNTVDSINIIGHIESSIIEGDKLYLIAILDDEKFDNTKDYICTYRAEMQTNPNDYNELLIINFFSVDLVTIEPDEKKPSMVLSTIELIDDDIDDLVKEETT